MQNAVLNVNGQILNPEEAKVSIFDRGFLYGDSLYEVARTYQGKFYLLDDHLTRLQASARLCHLQLDQTPEHYSREIYRTLEAFQGRPGNEKLEAYARLIVTRGVGKIGFGLGCLLSPSQYFVIVQPVEAPTSEQYQKGFKLQISERIRNDRRALDPAMKSGNYLNSLLGYLEAQDEGYDDALLCNFDGHLTEGTTFNIFYVRRGVIATPPLDIGILDGITRRKVLEIARDQGLEVREVRFPAERLYAADEVFMSSSVKEVFPVTHVDEKKIGDGTPGPITQKLHHEYQKAIRGIHT